MEGLNPAAGKWAGSVLDRHEPDDEVLSPQVKRMMERVEQGNALRALFKSEIVRVVGPFFPGDPARDAQGKTIMWEAAIWLPARWALFEEFKKRMPSDDEMAARMKWTEKHAIRYAYAKPGHTFSTEDIAEWLDKGE